MSKKHLPEQCQSCKFKTIRIVTTTTNTSRQIAHFCDPKNTVKYNMWRKPIEWDEDEMERQDYNEDNNCEYYQEKISWIKKLFQSQRGK